MQTHDTVYYYFIFIDMTRFSCLFLISFISWMTALGQSAEGRYASRMTQDGVIFFIMPQKLKKLKDIKKFEYDVTLLTWTDSATVNFTFESDQMNIPSSLSLLSGETIVYCKDFSPLFVDIKKNHYVIRITSKFHIKELFSLYNSLDPLTFCFTQDDVARSAEYKPSQWRKDRKKIKDIYQLYLLSK